MKTMIAELRRARGWSQAVLAERAGVRQATVSKAENHPTAVEVETMQLLGQALGVTIGDLFAPDADDASIKALMALAAQLPPEDRAVLERSAQGMLALRAREDTAPD